MHVHANTHMYSVTHTCTHLPNLISEHKWMCSAHSLSTNFHVLTKSLSLSLSLSPSPSLSHNHTVSLSLSLLSSESLLMLHKLLLSRIEACVSEPSPQFGALMCQFIPHMTIYTEFIKNHDQSIKVLEACLNANPSFTDFLENHHFSHDCDAQHLRMLLHQPVTRVSVNLRQIRCQVWERCDFLENFLNP